MSRFRFPSPMFSALAATLGLGAPGCLGCFARGTSVRTPGGDRAVDELKVGDRVLAFDPDRGLVTERVVRTFHHRRRPLLQVTTELGVTNTTLEHPYFTERLGFVPAGALEAGSQLVGLNGDTTRRARVLDVRPIERLADVWNLEVSRAHTYFAGGVLVHNKSAPCPSCEDEPAICEGHDVDQDGVPWETDCDDSNGAIGACRAGEQRSRYSCVWDYYGSFDAGHPDLGVGDAGAFDAGPSDGGAGDADATDAGGEDGG